MGLKQSKKALPEVIPQRICITFRRVSFWSRPKTWKMWIVKHPGRKHDKYHVRKPPQLFRKSQNSRTSIETGPIFDESGWESSHLNLKGATNPMGTLPTPKTAIENSKSTKNPTDPTDPTVHEIWPSTVSLESASSVHRSFVTLPSNKYRCEVHVENRLYL